MILFFQYIFQKVPTCLYITISNYVLLYTYYIDNMVIFIPFHFIINKSYHNDIYTQYVNKVYKNGICSFNIIKVILNYK